MSQDNTNFATIDPGTESGVDLATDLNSWRDAVRSTHSGATRPTYAVSGMLWVNDASASAWKLNIYDGANDITLLTIDTIQDSVTLGTITGPMLVHQGVGNATVLVDAAKTIGVRGDADVGMTVAAPNSNFASLFLGSPAAPSATQLRWKHSTKALSFGTVLTDATLDVITGAGVTAMHIDKDQNIGIGTTTPAAGLHYWKGASGALLTHALSTMIVEGSGANVGITLGSPLASTVGINFANPGVAQAAQVAWNGAGNTLAIHPNVAEASTWIGYGGTELGFFISGAAATPGWIGVWQTDPFSLFHIGSADVDANWSSLEGTQGLVVTHSTFLRVMLHGENAAGFNIIANASAVDKKLFAIDNKNGIVDFLAINDNLSARHTFIQLLLGTGQIYLPTLAEASKKTLKIESSGLVIAE